MSVEERTELMHLVTHPTRFKVVNALRGKDVLYISQIAEEIDADRRIASFHIKALEKAGLVTSELKRKDPPKGNPVLVRYVRLTEKALELLESVGL